MILFLFLTYRLYIYKFRKLYEYSLYSSPQNEKRKNTSGLCKNIIITSYDPSSSRVGIQRTLLQIYLNRESQKHEMH